MDPRVGSAGGFKHTLRPPHRVKFSVGSENGNVQEREEEIDLGQLEDGLHQGTAPLDSEDVADIHLSMPDWTGRTHAAAEHAQSRANRLASRLSYASPASRGNSVTSPYSSPPLKPITDHAIKLDDIPLAPLEKRPYDINEDTASDEDLDIEHHAPLKRENENIQEAKRLIRTLTNRQGLANWHEPRSGTETPAVDKRLHDLDYIPPPEQYKPGILGAILSSRLSDLQRDGFDRPNYADPFTKPKKKTPKDCRRGIRSGSDTPESSTQTSGLTTPSKRPKWYEKDSIQSSSSVATLVAQSLSPASAAVPLLPGSTATSPTRRPSNPSRRSSGMISSAVDIIRHGANHLRSKSDRQKEEHHMIQEVAEIIARRKYLIKLCNALMMYGAPTHRMEEYMRTSARALQVEAEFLYMPGSMLCCFLDSIAYTTQVEMVRQTQGVDLGKFKDVFNIYKCVIHDKYDAEEGTRELDLIRHSGNEYPTWFRILAFGIAAVAVSPWAFSARPIDFGPIFILGAVLGVMQLVIVPRSEQFSHVFEVAAAVVTSFIARALGSIQHDGQSIFCFSAMAQSSIALILPGYIILCASLELQSRNMVSGAVRMVFAIIYTLFLGFGLLIGTTIFGLIYSDATSDVVCNIPPWWQAPNNSWSLLYVKFLWVPLFTVCLAIINQAKWRQMPAMTLISFCGYQANFWVSTRIARNLQVANAIGAFVIGSLANLYSRFFHGLAAAAMLPAIFVQVPSGLAASGSLVAGITSANQITGNWTGISIVNNGTQGFLNAQNYNSSLNGEADTVYGGTIFNVGYGMVQVAIGISVGLYLSALVVYPYGKRKSGLFTF